MPPLGATGEGVSAAARAWRAYWYGIANGILFNSGAAFIDPVTVLPSLVLTFTPSRIAVGLISAIGNSGWYLPQLVSASYLQGKPHKRPLYLAGVWVRSVSMAALIPCLLLLGSRPGLALAAFFVCYTIYSGAGGLTGPSFMDIVAKTVPAGKVGAFFGHRMVWGGLGGIGAGVAVRAVLASPRIGFPEDYALLFGIALALTVMGFVAFALIEEPAGKVVAEPQPLLRFLRSAPAAVRSDRPFRLVLTSSVLSGTVAIAMPFYIVYARQELAAPAAMVGTYIAVQMAGSVLLVPLWTYLNDRRGARALLMAANSVCLASTAIALAVTLLPWNQAIGRLALMLVFFPLVAVGSGTFIGYTSYLFRIAPEEQRTRYVGIHNTLFAFTTFLPLLGGLLVEAGSFRVLFAVSLVFAAATVVATARLPRLDAGPSA
ncbi:MAG: MFS transporter [Armatimonadota bacterium]